MVLAKLAQAAVVAIAACAAVAVIGISLAVAPGWRAQAIEARSEQIPTGETRSPIAADPGFQSISRTDRGIPESQPPGPGGEKGNRIVAKPEQHRSAFGEEVERAIQRAVRFLKRNNDPMAPGPRSRSEANTGTTSLVTLALLTAGETPDSPAILKALDYLRNFGPDELRNTYAISLQTMVFAAADPDKDRLRLAGQRGVAGECADQARRAGRLARHLELFRFQEFKAGDNSNTQYALLGLNAASEAGVPVKRGGLDARHELLGEVPESRRELGLHPASTTNRPASMTCAGISSLIIAGIEAVAGSRIPPGREDRRLRQGRVQSGTCMRGSTGCRRQLPGRPERRTGPEVEVSITFTAWNGPGGSRASGSSARNDWYRLGAEELVHDQDKLSGFWRGALIRRMI